eukprot:2048482-Amphidinium_carterae.2
MVWKLGDNLFLSLNQGQQDDGDYILPTMGDRTRKRRKTEVPNGKRSGQELEDAGGIKLKGKAVSGRTVLMRMRLTEVHKPLASAHRALQQHVAFLTGEGGVLFPKDSLPGRELERYANELWYKHKKQTIPLYQENGVYNLYVQPSADLSATETAGAVSAGLSGNQAARSAARAGLSRTETASAPASFAVYIMRPQVRPVQGNPAELAANEETGERLVPDTDMPAEGEEGLEERTFAKVLRGPYQPTAAEISRNGSGCPTRDWVVKRYREVLLSEAQQRLRMSA